MPRSSPSGFSFPGATVVGVPVGGAIVVAGGIVSAGGGAVVSAGGGIVSAGGGTVGSVSIGCSVPIVSSVVVWSSVVSWASATLLTVRAAANKITFITRSEEHTSELQSLMRISYAVF